MSPRNRLSPIERFKSFAVQKTDRNTVSDAQLEQLEPRTLLSAVYTVDTIADENDGLGVGTGTSLREAINAANNTLGLDTIVFDAGIFTGGTETITLDSLLGELDITEDLSIDASTVSGVTVDGDGNSRVFDISAGQTVGISSLNIVGGYTTGYGGGIRMGSASVVTLAYVNIENNTAFIGGGIYNGGVLTANKSTISYNHGDYRGGGLFGSDGASMAITESSVTGNTGGQGAGVFVKASYLNIYDSSFSGNLGYIGGAVAGFFYSTVTIDNSSITGNQSTSANYGGGGIVAWDNTYLVLTNSTVTSNAASSGAGIYARTLSSVTVTDSTISGNTATIDGGGIFVASSSILQLSRSTLSGNIATQGGGVLAGTNGSVTIENSTLSANVGIQYGGGLYSGANANVAITNSTFNNNTAAISGGGIFSPQGQVSLANTIVANSSGGDVIAFGAGQVLTSGINIVEDGSLSGGGILNLDPNLDVLADNGGSTRTHALLSGSPAIDAGDNSVILLSSLTTDQRGGGFPRMVGQVDIGAFELIPTALVVDTLTDEFDSDYSVGDLSLREAIYLANSHSDDSTITFDTAVFSGGDDTISLGLGEMAITENVAINATAGNEVIVDAGDGSRIFDIDDSTVSMSHMSLMNASTSTNGGAIFQSSGALTLTNMTISENEAEKGGGIFLDGVTATISLSTISGNSANNDGGGLYTKDGDVNIDDSTISLNYSGDDGGGISG